MNPFPSCKGLEATAEEALYLIKHFEGHDKVLLSVVLYRLLA